MKSAEDIIEFLKKAFNTPSTKDEKWKVVVLCIIISTTFWFFSALNKSDYVTQINYPIKVVYNDSLYVALAPIPEKISLEVSGGGWDLMARFFGFFMEPLIIDLKNPLKDNFRLTNNLRQDIAPKLEPVNVNYFLQDSLIFKIDERHSVRLKLAFDSAKIKLPDNYKISSKIRLAQDSITLFGPRRLLSEIQSPILINPGSNQFTENVDTGFALPEFGSALISANRTDIQVQFEVIEYLTQETSFPIYPINFRGDNFEIEPNQVLVTYEINVNQVNEIDSTDLILTADFLNLRNRDKTIPIEITIKSPLIVNPKLNQQRVKLKSNG